MTLIQKRIITLAIVILAGIVLGRLAVRGFEPAGWGKHVWGGFFMRKKKEKKRGRVMWGFLYAGTFVAAFAASAVFKMKYNPLGKKYTVAWSDSVGKIYKDLVYGKEEANKFDLYVPADTGKESYGLVIYLHAGGFTTGDKSGDADILKWLCSKGYVAAGAGECIWHGRFIIAAAYAEKGTVVKKMGLCDVNNVHSPIFFATKSIFPKHRCRIFQRNIQHYESVLAPMHRRSFENDLRQ